MLKEIRKSLLDPFKESKLVDTIFQSTLKIQTFFNEKKETATPSFGFSMSINPKHKNPVFVLCLICIIIKVPLLFCCYFCQVLFLFDTISQATFQILKTIRYKELIFFWHHSLLELNNGYLVFTKKN